MICELYRLVLPSSIFLITEKSASNIERNYAVNDIERSKATLDRLNNKLNVRKQELTEFNSNTTIPAV